MPGGRELTIYAVDVSPSMGELMTVDDPSTGTTKSVTKLEYSLEVIKHQVANMLLAGLKTAHCGIVLFGTDRKCNHGLTRLVDDNDSLPIILKIPKTPWQLVDTNIFGSISPLHNPVP